jgi:hypothetical protein
MAKYFWRFVMADLPKFYFIGEYGFAFRQLLPFLEKCTWSMELVTWKTICIVIELLWPGRYTLIDGETIIGKVDPRYRECTHLSHIPSTQKLEGLGYKHFFSIDPNKKNFFDNSISLFNTISKKIIYGEQSSEKKYISIFPRNRKGGETSRNDDLNEPLAWVYKTYPNHEVVSHGLVGERFNLNVNYVKDTYDQINVFNNSLFLLTPPSGLADFALACGCDLILTGEYRNIEKTNPHGCSIKYWRDLV